MLVLMDEAQVSGLLGVTKNTLACWRSRGTGPAYVKMGEGRRSKVRYRAADVEAWIRRRVVRPGKNCKSGGACHE